MPKADIVLSDDGWYVMVAGRRWRATDTTIPERLCAELVAELMSARRDVRVDPATARPRVNDAKWRWANGATHGEIRRPRVARRGWQPACVFSFDIAARMRRSAPVTLLESSAGPSWRTLMSTAKALLRSPLVRML